jgi:hypothetical protein
MSFFSELETPDADFREPEPRRVRWRGDPEDSVGVVVPIGPFELLNDQVGIVVSNFFAYPNGFAFTLVTISRLNPAPSPLGFHHGGAPGRQGVTGGELRFGMGFADGSKVFQQHRVVPGQGPSPRTMRSRGGGGGGRKWQHEFWIEPLPPMGLMNFVFEWRDYGVPETYIDVDAAPVVEASTRATPLWPEDKDLPEETDSTPRGFARWNSRTYGN